MENLNTLNALLSEQKMIKITKLINKTNKKSLVKKLWRKAKYEK